MNLSIEELEIVEEAFHQFMETLAVNGDDENYDSAENVFRKFKDKKETLLRVKKEESK